MSIRPSVAQRLGRLRELLFLARHHIAGPASIARMLAGYATILRNPMSVAPMALSLRHQGRRISMNLRRSDIFTVAEIFHERQYALTHSLGAAPRIVDAGANVGLASAWFLLEYPDARLLAIEPASSNFTLLAANLGSRSDVSLARLALGDRDGTVDLVLAAHGAEHSVHARPGSSGVETVPCRRLDRLLDEYRIDRIDLLKLDVEGSEFEVLQGLGDRIDSVGTLVGEVHERQIDVASFYAFLDRRHFTVIRRQYFGSGRADGVHTFEARRQ